MDENLPKDETSGKPRKTSAPKMPLLDSYAIIGRIFLTAPQEDDQHFRVFIVRNIDNY